VIAAVVILDAKFRTVQEDPVRLTTAVTQDDGIQYVTTDMSEDVQSIAVFVDMPAKWLIHISNESAEGTLSIPTFQFQCELQVGDNIIEFTPKISGAYDFTCNLGKGSIVVLEGGDVG
jgi:hypothetical protein